MGYIYSGILATDRVSVYWGALNIALSAGTMAGYRHPCCFCGDEKIRANMTPVKVKRRSDKGNRVYALACEECLICMDLKKRGDKFRTKFVKGPKFMLLDDAFKFSGSRDDARRLRRQQKRKKEKVKMGLRYSGYLVHHTAPEFLSDLGYMITLGLYSEKRFKCCCCGKIHSIMYGNLLYVYRQDDKEDRLWTRACFACTKKLGLKNTKDEFKDVQFIENCDFYNP